MVLWVYFENKNFAKGSLKIAQSILKNKKALKVVGGGETIALFNQTTSNLEKFQIYLFQQGEEQCLNI